MSTLRVDWTRCDGHGVCARLLPEAIALDEWGFPIVGDIAGVDRTLVNTAVSTCPRLALRVEK